MLTLKAQKRDKKENLNILRKTAKLPAVFYGRKAEATPIVVSLKDFMQTLKTAGESTIINLQEGDTEHQVLIQDVAKDPVRGTPIHADFYVIEKDQKLKIKIPIEFDGVAPAVKDLGGILVKVMHELEIEALPKDLPHSIPVNISSLKDFKSQILARDIELPKGVALVTGIDEVIAAVAEAKIEEEKPPETIDLSAIEVEKKGKEAKEGEGEAAEASAEPAKEKKES